jgi:hypothetical protein
VHKTEEAFMRGMERRGWTVLKRGWPDFLCIRGDRIVAVEVKTDDIGLTEKQIAVQDALKRVGLTVITKRATVTSRTGNDQTFYGRRPKRARIHNMEEFD